MKKILTLVLAALICLLPMAAVAEGAELTLASWRTEDGEQVNALLAEYENLTGVKITYEIAPRRAGDVARVYADPTKSRELLGWRAELSLEDMCRDAWNWQKNNPDGYRS